MFFGHTLGTLVSPKQVVKQTIDKNIFPSRSKSLCCLSDMCKGHAHHVPGGERVCSVRGEHGQY